MKIKKFLLNILLSFLLLVSVATGVFMALAFREDEAANSPAPSPTGREFSVKEKEELEFFIDCWKKSYENCADDISFFYVDHHKESIKVLMEKQQTIKMEITGRDFEEDRGIVYVTLKIKSSAGDDIREGIARLTLQKPQDSSWRIFEISCKPDNLLIYEKDYAITEEEIPPLPETTSEPIEDVSLYIDSGDGEPEIIERFLPYENWTEEYTDYFQRHYHEPVLTLVPQAIVMHYTACDSLEGTIATFSNGQDYDDGDVGVVFGHLSVHFVIDKDGTVYYTLPWNRRCRGAYGVNHVALSIEMVALDQDSLLSQEATVSASFKLVKKLMDRFNIPKENVWGHYHVSYGKNSETTVRNYYTDFGDNRSPDCYPPEFGRSDPGAIYMERLMKYLTEMGY